MDRKKHSMDRVQYYMRFQASTRGLGTFSLHIRGSYCNCIFYHCNKLYSNEGNLASYHVCSRQTLPHRLFTMMEIFYAHAIQ